MNTIDFEIKTIESKRLSLYRTKNRFDSFCEVRTNDDFLHLLDEAGNRNLQILFLGNGSNTFFSRQRITTLVAKNCLPKKIESIEGDKFFVSSSVLVSDLLKYCFSEGRDSFFYLASVPAEIGGALAMNAGQGRSYGQSIMDYVEEIHYLDQNGLQIAKPSEVGVGYRRTMFTGLSHCLIIGAVFRFIPRDFEGRNPIKERIAWAKVNQDLASPNCGTVFSHCDSRIMYRLRGLRIGGTGFSRKTDNWISNRSEQPWRLRLLVGITKALHFVFFRKCKSEIIIVK